MWFDIMAGKNIHKTNPDLEKERLTSTINIEEIASIIYRGSNKLEKKRRLDKLVYEDPDYKSIPLEFMSREELYEEGLRRATLGVMKKNVLGDAIENESDWKRYNLKLMPVNVLFTLNYGMFVPTIMSQGTEEQKKKYAVPALNHDIIGTYAQTEMGHGTFLRGLETTARYDANTEEFILHSPTVTSTKWWPGALGKTSTHAVVLAQLYIDEKCHGLHSFIVQLRSLDDHKPLPGITVGDIGPKFGYDDSDNGFLRLNNVRIPRSDMLMRYAQVAPDGTYTKPPKATLTYGTMTLVRSTIVEMCAFWLAKACTIAIRYSAVRRQSEVRPGEAEPQVLSYQTQQHKLFPLLASAYALTFAGHAMVDFYDVVAAKVKAGDFSRSQELHALSSGLKAFASWTANFGSETCRMSCGGHGYSQASGFPALYTLYTPACTYEGENTVLMLQCARYLIKCTRDAMTNGSRLPETVGYLQKSHHPARRSSRANDLDFLDHVYMRRAHGLVYSVSERVSELMRDGDDLLGAMNKSSVDLVRAAIAHSHYFVVHNMVAKLKSLPVSTPSIDVLKQLALLYSTEGIVASSGDVLENGILRVEQVQEMRELSVQLLAAVRPNAVALVDAFQFHDRELNSVLGRYDGHVYENLLEWAQSSPLNATDVHHSSYNKHLGPLLKRNRNRSKL